MFNIERWQEIFEAISKNKLRTFLTGLSVSSGIFILIILLGISSGMQKGTKKQFAKDAETKIQFNGRKTSKGYQGLTPNRRIHFSEEDYEYISNRFADDIDYQSASYRKWGGIVSHKKESGSYTVYGVMPDMLYLENATLNIGRFISEKDIKEESKIAVIGIQAARDLFKNYKRAIGKYITINNIEYKVIGVYSDSGGEREDANVFIPHSQMIKTYNSQKDIGSLWFTLAGNESYEATNNKANKFIEQITQYLKTKHRIHPEDEKAIRSFNAIESSKNILLMFSMMRLFFWGIGLLTLVAGIVSVANIMLIIVKERTKEIGIRKALGAQPKSIIAMILHEAIFITTLSGFLGLFSALLLLEFVGPKIETDFILNPSVSFNVAVSTVLLLVVSGAIAGFIPANHAAKIKPIIALRDD